MESERKNLLGWIIFRILPFLPRGETAICENAQKGTEGELPKGKRSHPGVYLKWANAVKKSIKNNFERKDIK